MSYVNASITFIALITIEAKTGATSIYGTHDLIEVIKHGAHALDYECRVSHFEKPLKVTNFDCQVNVQLEPKGV